MARRIEQLPHPPGRTPVAEQYPWDKWLDGNPWSLRHGTDFHVTLRSMRTYAYEQAAARGHAINTSTDTINGILYIQAKWREPR